MRAAGVDTSVGPVSVVVPLRDEATSLEVLLESIARQSRPPDEIVLVDGGSCDGTPELARQLTSGDPRVRVIEIGDATPGAGRNAGIAAAAHEWIALTDGGIELEADWLEKLEAAAGRNHGDVVYGMYEPFPGSFFDRCAALAYVEPARPSGGRRVRPPFIASALMRRSVWRAAGGFPDLRAAEDQIFIERVRRSGASSVSEPDARVWWHVAPTFPGTFRRFRAYSRHNVTARQEQHWHHGVARQYALALPFLLLGLRRRTWLLVPGFGFSARVISRAIRGRDEKNIGWALHPARLTVVAAITATVDAAMFVGWIDALLERTHAPSRGS